MIGQSVKRGFQNTLLKSQSRYGAMIQQGSRGFAGGGVERAAIDASTTEFDLVVVGGIHAVAMTKFMQQHDDAQNLKIAVVSNGELYVNPSCYMPAVLGILAFRQLEGEPVPGQIAQWSMCEANTSVTALNPTQNTMTLSNGKEFSYKALVLGTGFDHSSSHVEGLTDFDMGEESNNIFAHIMDNRERVKRNFWNAYYNRGGDLLCYSPKAPYKGEGSDFYALFYESFLRQDQLVNAAAYNSRVQYWTPNKEIFQFPYANEVALDMCHKRGVEVMFGWELTKVHEENHGRKVGTFKNVDTGATIEKDFTTMSINPPSKPNQFLVDAGVTDHEGLVDVNKYTLQHKKFENIFAIGDCISGKTTRTMAAGISQNPIVKNNVLRFLHGKEPNALWDGYSWMPFLTGQRSAAGFSHLHDFEPAPTNHSWPAYGMMSRMYFRQVNKSWSQKQGQAYAGAKKNHGPPHNQYAARYDELEHSEYLQNRQIPVDEVRHPNLQARLATTSAQMA